MGLVNQPSAVFCDKPESKWAGYGGGEAKEQIYPGEAIGAFGNRRAIVEGLNQVGRHTQGCLSEYFPVFPSEHLHDFAP